MTIVLESLLAFILVYKYAALFVITFVAAFFLPLPASTTLVAASAFAFQGYFSFPAVFGIALLGNIAGDNLGFFISKKYGEELLRLIGFKKILTSPNFHMLKEYTKTNTASLIFVSRFMTEIGPSVNVLSGIIGMSYRKSLFYEITGEASYVLLYSSIGYYLGSRWENGVNFLTTAGIFMTSLGLLFFLIQSRLFKRGRNLS